ncbi:hypothetical protein [Aureivirga sp. CE67]|uniref:hypothetical protein n=1 Tax=Aureivirga sp. CE67 TaxID=1788983 RepID=UPI0018CA672F|nr:hypothetical protein [Aureivirga sp. CE67]
MSVEISLMIEVSEIKYLQEKKNNILKQKLLNNLVEYLKSEYLYDDGEMMVNYEKTSNLKAYSTLPLNISGFGKWSNQLEKDIDTICKKLLENKFELHVSYDGGLE